MKNIEQHAAPEKTQSFKLLVCGGRDFHDEKALRRWMNKAIDGRTDVMVIHGGARGADSLAGRIAKQAGVSTWVFPADWAAHGKAAGHIRNKQMLDEGRPHLVLAAPGGRGTANMVAQARAVGVPVIEISEAAER